MTMIYDGTVVKIDFDNKMMCRSVSTDQSVFKSYYRVDYETAQDIQARGIATKQITLERGSKCALTIKSGNLHLDVFWINDGPIKMSDLMDPSFNNVPDDYSIVFQYDGDVMLVTTTNETGIFSKFGITDFIQNRSALSSFQLASMMSSNEWKNLMEGF